MEIINVKNLEEAVFYSRRYLPNSNDKSNIALTGGRFGHLFLEDIKKRNLDIRNWKIFQTDERVLCKEEYVIQKTLISNLSKCKGYESKNLKLFSYKENYLESIDRLAKEINNIPDKVLDICYLSLGEDGHLAGHFKNTKKQHVHKIFEVTNEAPKEPKNRISFSIKWLMKAKKLIIISIGEEKKKELNKLINGIGFHSYIIEHNAMTIITNTRDQGHLGPE